MKVLEFTFEDQSVVLDFHEYRGCTFRRCHLVFHGLGPLSLVDCNFDGCSWGFEGPSAQTIGFMTAMWQMGGGARDLIDQTMANIRAGRHPGSPPPR